VSWLFLTELVHNFK